MRQSRLAFVSTLISCLLAGGSALAQEAAPAEAAPAEAAPAPAAEAGAAAAPAAEAEAPAAETAPPAAPEPEEAPAIPGWFRIDSDGLGLQLWAGATHDLGGGVGLATDMLVSYAGESFGEFDIGPTFAVADGGLVITPMVGMVFAWNQRRAVSLVPQLYFVGAFGPVYFESWWQLFLNKPFTDAATNNLYTRHFVTYSIMDELAVGPAIEPTFGIGDGQDAIISMPVGGIAKVAYGEGATFFGFLGYETNSDARDATDGNALAGRLTFVKNW